MQNNRFVDLELFSQQKQNLKNDDKEGKRSPLCHFQKPLTNEQIMFELESQFPEAFRFIIKQERMQNSTEQTKQNLESIQKMLDTVNIGNNQTNGMK